MAIDIRLATHEDIPILEALISASVRGLSVDYYTQNQIESAIVHIFGVDSQLITDATYYVAQAEGEIVGCGGWSKRKTLFGGDQMKADEDSLLDPAVDAARIRAFFVHPDWTRKGIGTRIIQTCETAAQQSGFNKFELAATLPGVPLYQAVGYQAVEQFDVPMADGEQLPIVKMVKHLEPESLNP